ncbi:MAG TPA: hypothetical protein VGW74_07070 [Propionibacteriaceae bacterium]|nr:hypothetical protein [Propionibacteriaceae bacterium]
MAAYQCPSSYEATTADRLGRVMACPARGCGKADVAVTPDAFGVPVFEPHAYAPKSARPAGHLPACKGDDGKVEDCRCPVGAVA